MLRASTLAALLFASALASAQTPGVLRVTVTLPDATQAPVPIAGHALLISDNPPTREPRRIVTNADGMAIANLSPGPYIVESDRPAGFLGQAYQWTTFVDVVAGRETTVAFTAQNAAVLPMSAAAPPDPRAASPESESPSLGRWQSSLVTVWSPTSLASGFVVDARGLIATDRNGVGRATRVEVQVSPTMKVPGRVLVAETTHDVAIVWVDPAVLATAPPVPLACPPAAAPRLDDGQEVQAITTSRRGPGAMVQGEVTGFHPRGIETDLRLSFGESGGPVFTGDGVVVGLTSVPADPDARRGDVLIVRAGILCEALSAAQSKMSASPPEPTPLPVESARASPAAATGGGSQAAGNAAPAVASSADFDIAFITPPVLQSGRDRADRTGGRRVRSPEAEARLGRLTDFGAWTEYFADAPPLLIVRVTPKLVEGFWKRLGREAARTQGAVLPAFKDFKTNFVSLRALCGGTEVTPIHPFVLEHPVDDTRVVREGLYVFDPDALGPHCGSVSISISSEQAPQKPDTRAVDSKIVELIWQDFAPYRAAGR